MKTILTLLIVVVFIVSGCAEKKEETTNLQRAEFSDTEGLDQKVLQFDLTAYTDQGAKRWEIKGKSADVVDHIVELKDIVASTYGKNNTLTLKATEGTYDKEANKVQFVKDVVITTSDGAKVLAETMDWDSKNNIITADGAVKIEREEITLWGRGVRGEPELKQARFDKEIKIEMDDGQTVITCDGPMDIDYENNSAVFKNNVKIVDLKGEVSSNTLQAYLNPKTKEIVKAIATGDVRIIRGDNHSKSQEAIYLAEEHKVVLTGRPEITIYPDEEFDASILVGGSAESFSKEKSQ